MCEHDRREQRVSVWLATKRFRGDSRRPTADGRRTTRYPSRARLRAPWAARRWITMTCDRPRPGTGYLALLLALTALSCLMFGLVVPELRGAGRLEWIAAVVVMCSVEGLVAATIDAAFRTRYEISDRGMRLRSGFVIRAEIRYRDVASVEPVGFIPRVLGWGGRARACEPLDGWPSDHAALRSGLLHKPLRTRGRCRAHPG